MLSSFLDLIYPRECMACGARLSPGDHACLCAECLGALPRITSDRCSRCGNALGPYAEGKFACPSCSRLSGLFFRGAAAVCRYEGAAREVVHRLKYGRDLRAAAWMSREMSECVQQPDWFDRIDAVVPVPLHWTRRLSRRFNQSDLLAQEISRACAKPVLAHVLRRIRRTESQALLTGAKREENVRGGFRAVRPKRISGKGILLVDDVMSTCATAAECSRALVRAGARRVYVIVFAR